MFAPLFVMKTYTLPRVYLPTETLGSIYDDTGALICKTMELPWRKNKSSADYLLASCIPEDTYVVHKQAPEARRDYGYFRLEFVPGRNIDPQTGWSRILIHRISYVSGLLGCIGVGGRFVDLNKDGVPDMAESSKKLQWMYDNLPDTFLLKITKKLA